MNEIGARGLIIKETKTKQNRKRGGSRRGLDKNGC